MIFFQVRNKLFMLKGLKPCNKCREDKIEKERETEKEREPHCGIR